MRDALAAGVTETGCTVHEATLEMDAGPILAQESVPVLAGDTEQTLHERIKAVERAVLPPRRHTGGPRALCASREAEGRSDRIRTQRRSRRGDDVVRALLSVYDKDGLVDLAQGLSDLGWELVASGNTSAKLTEAGIAHLEVAQVTGSPEMLGGRVKTLHPKIHGGILADRSKPEHLDDLEANGIEAVDLVVSNLYPFASDPSVELIDIGGPAMVRAAAKNHEHVGIVTSPADYPAVLEELRTSGSLSAATRRRLARAAFVDTAAYDAAIVAWLDSGGPAPYQRARGRHPGGRRGGRAVRSAPADSASHARAHRSAALRREPAPARRRYRVAGAASWWDAVEQHGGRPLSYLNLFDGDAAWRLVHELAGDAGTGTGGGGHHQARQPVRCRRRRRPRHRV